jgi:F420-non-reducing hydrogenase iron-sulfur subunit
MCTGRLDLAHVLRAFADGADGVSIAGCHLNECNYTTQGNFHALSMTYLGKKLLEYVGLNPDRLRIDLVSAAEGNRFAEIMTGFGKTIKQLGPLGRSEGVDEAERGLKLQTLSSLVPYIKLQKLEKLKTRLPSEADYQDLFSLEEIEELLRDVPSYYIDPDKCQACMICAKRCPVDAIDGARNVVHVIDQQTCVKCGTCFAVCPPRYGAVTKLCGQPVPPPIPDEQRTIVKQHKGEAA